jgi:hypothetical protein
LIQAQIRGIETGTAIAGLAGGNEIGVVLFSLSRIAEVEMEASLTASVGSADVFDHLDFALLESLAITQPSNMSTKRLAVALFTGQSVSKQTHSMTIGWQTLENGS